MTHATPPSKGDAWGDSEYPSIHKGGAHKRARDESYWAEFVQRFEESGLYLILISACLLLAIVMVVIILVG